MKPVASTVPAWDLIETGTRAATPLSGAAFTFDVCHEKWSVPQKSRQSSVVSRQLKTKTSQTTRKS